MINFLKTKLGNRKYAKELEVLRADYESALERHNQITWSMQNSGDRGQLRLKQRFDQLKTELDKRFSKEGAQIDSDRPQE